MSNNKVKGLLKGLRYISQIFDNNEKKAEMQIGYPTDVKHVAHIGWDSQSVNSPSWCFISHKHYRLLNFKHMNEFKMPPSFSSAPLSLTPVLGDGKKDVAVTWVCEDSSNRRGRGSRVGVGVTNSIARELPKPSIRSQQPSPSGSGAQSPMMMTTKEKPEKPIKTRRSSKTKQSSNHDIVMMNNDSPITLSAENNIPRNGRRKKASTRSKTQVPAIYQSPFSDPGSGSTGSIPIISKHTALCQTP